MIEILTPEALIPPELFSGLNERQITQFVEILADAARAEWIRLAQQDSSSFAQDYARGIQKPVVAQGTAVISLVGSVANMLEHGAPGVDLRDLLLGGDVPTVPRGERGKHEAKEGGYYRAIPFRHATPGASGGVVGQEMGSAYSGHQAVADAKKLAQEVYGQALKLQPHQNREAKPSERRLPAGMAPKLRDHHKTDIYAGMIREEKTYESATQGQYFTFRTISTHVTEVSEGAGGKNVRTRVPATVGWQRGPIHARNYAEQVAAYVTRIAPDTVAALLGGAE